jgi:hypothetical protein
MVRAEPIHRLAAGFAALSFFGSWPVIKAGMNDAAIVPALVRSQMIFGLNNAELEVCFFY